MDLVEPSVLFMTFGFMCLIFPIGASFAAGVRSEDEFIQWLVGLPLKNHVIMRALSISGFFLFFSGLCLLPFSG